MGHNFQCVESAKSRFPGERRQRTDVSGSVRQLSARQDHSITRRRGMKRFVRQLTSAVAAICTLTASVAWGQANYPIKPLRIIVPWPPGGGADVIMRMLSPKLSEALGQQVIVDNRGGAA